MRKLWAVAVVAMLVAACGCGDEETVVRITDPPEIDHSAINEYVQIAETNVGPDGLMVTMSGTAKVDMGKGLPLRVDRFKDGTMLDTVTSRIVQARQPEIPEGFATPDAGPPPPAMASAGPPPIPLIAAGDPVTISIDATTIGAKISKLVVKPGQ